MGGRRTTAQGEGGSQAVGFVIAKGCPALLPSSSPSFAKDWQYFPRNDRRRTVQGQGGRNIASPTLPYPCYFRDSRQLSHLIEFYPNKVPFVV